MELEEYLTPDCLRPPKPIEELRLGTLSDLQKDTWNVNYFLRATVTNSALVCVFRHFGSIGVVVHGNPSVAATLNVGHLCLSRRELAKRYPVGALVLIRSPYLLDTEACNSLLVGHPNAANVVRCYSGLYKVGNPDSLINRGQADLQLARYSQAVENFDAATKLLQTDDERSFEAKYLAADALFRDNKVEECVLRAKRIPAAWKDYHRCAALIGRSQLALGSYSEAYRNLSWAMTLVGDGPEKEVYEQDLAKASRLKLQNRTGVFDYEVAEYVGPVEIRRGKYGRGVFVTREVRSGELLMVCKPIVVSNNLSESDQTDTLVSRIVRACNVSRRVRAQVNCMQSDPQEEPESVPPMEYFLMSAGLEEDSPDEENVDINHIKGVLSHNRSVFVNTFMENVDGLWGLVSFVNHACSSNVSVIVIRDIVFVNASKSLSAGTELFRNYHQLEQRESSPMPCAEFDCELDCSRCRLVAEEPWRSLALSYRDTFRTAGMIPGWVADTLEAELAEREERLPESEFVKLRPLRAAFAWAYTATVYCDLPTAVHVMADLSEYSSGERFELCDLIYSSSLGAWEEKTAREEVREWTGETQELTDIWFGSINAALLRKIGVLPGGSRSEVTDSVRVAKMYYSKAFVATFGQQSDSFMIPLCWRVKVF